MKETCRIYALQKKAFSIVANQMNKYDIPPLLQTIQENTYVKRKWMGL